MKTQKKGDKKGNDSSNSFFGSKSQGTFFSSQKTASPFFNPAPIQTKKDEKKQDKVEYSNLADSGLTTLQLASGGEGATQVNNLAELRKILGYFNVPEAQVVELCGQLNPSEVQTVISDSYFKTKMSASLSFSEMKQAVINLDLPLNLKLSWLPSAGFMGTGYSNIQDLITSASTSEKNQLKTDDWKKYFVSICTNKTILTALNDLGFDIETKRSWKRAEGLFVAELIHKKGFISSLEGVKLSSELLNKMNNLCNYLIDNDLVRENITFNDAVRSPKRAHLWSTAYHIVDGQVPEANLKKLEEGQDQDGNLWYKEGWTQEQIIANAKSVREGELTLAYEGYRAGSSQRLPNVDSVPLSQHCVGNAIDASIRWKNGDGWHQEAKDLVKKFGLARPVKTEHWHFELPTK